MTISRNHTIESVIMGGFAGRTSKINTYNRSTISIIRRNAAIGKLNPVKDNHTRMDFVGTDFLGTYSAKMDSARRGLIIGGSPG